MSGTSEAKTYPCILEGPLVHLSSLLLELLDDTLVNASQLVDQVTSCGGLARVDMSNNHDVQMSLFLTHTGYRLQTACSTPARLRNCRHKTHSRTAIPAGELRTQALNNTYRKIKNWLDVWHKTVALQHRFRWQKQRGTTNVFAASM